VNVRWKLFGTFCALALVLLALVPGLSALFGSSMDFAALATRASEETGVPWTSSLWDVVRLSLAEPGLWLLVVGSSVPTLAALVTLVIARDRALWKDFVGRLHPFGAGSGSKASQLGAYALLVVGIVACLMLVFGIRGWVSPGTYTRSVDVLSAGVAWAILMAAFLDQGAVLEEGGWRGFATPLLQGKTWSPLAVSVLIGVVWALWHVPRDVVSGVIERLGFVEYALLFLPAFALGCITTSILASYFMNRIGGSLLPAIMVHGLTNDAMGLSGVVTIEQALTPYHQITKALPFTLFVAMILWIAGRQLGLRPSPTDQARRADRRRSRRWIG
jgi:hypothetical protein